MDVIIVAGGALGERDSRTLMPDTWILQRTQQTLLSLVVVTDRCADVVVAPSCCVVIGGGGARFCFETAYGTYIYFLMCMDQSFLRQG